MPRPAAPVSVWAAACVASSVLVAALNFLDAQGDPALDLVALCVFAAVLSMRAHLVAAPGTALVCWLLLNGFATPPMGELTWAAPYDLGRLACLLLAAGTGTLVGRLTGARAAYHRVSIPDGRRADGTGGQSPS
ncbi:hypothetical protein ACFWUZ_12225 [Streptomyces sp. NPDC058646]|uniref:hypothetical protein n=1 Tax=Streptomyces sp. NPDC058646 TaxID=3346574 RepID=UPI00364F8296